MSQEEECKHEPIKQRFKSRVKQFLDADFELKRERNAQVQSELAKKGLSLDDRRRVMGLHREVAVMEAEDLAAKEMELPPRPYKAMTVINKMSEMHQRAAMGSSSVESGRDRKRRLLKEKEKAQRARHLARAEKIKEHRLAYGTESYLEVTEDNDGLDEETRNLAMTTNEKSDLAKSNQRKETAEMQKQRAEMRKNLAPEKKKLIQTINMRQVEQQFAWRKETKGMTPAQTKEWHATRREQQTLRVYQMIQWQSQSFFNIAHDAYTNGVLQQTGDGSFVRTSKPGQRVIVDVVVPPESTFHFSRKWIPDITVYSLEWAEKEYKRASKNHQRVDNPREPSEGRLPPPWTPGMAIVPHANPWVAACHRFASVLHDMRTYDVDTQFAFSITKRNDSYDDVVDFDATERPNNIHGKIHKDSYLINHEIAKRGPLKAPPPRCAHSECGWFLLAGAKTPFLCDRKCVESAYDVFCTKECLEEHYKEHHKAHYKAVTDNRNKKRTKDKERKLAQKQRKQEREEARLTYMQKNPEAKAYIMPQIALEANIRRAKRKAAVEKLDRDCPDYYVGDTLCLRGLWHAIDEADNELP